MITEGQWRRWKDNSTTDDRLNTYVLSDIRQMLGEIERLRSLLADAPIIVIDERYAAFCEEDKLLAYAQAVREWHPKVAAALSNGERGNV